MVTARTHVAQMYEDSNEVSEYLKAQQISLSVIADEIFRKSLLVAAASYFEQRVKDILLEYVRESTSGNERVVELVRSKITDRGYHGLFDWRSQNANQFWRSFDDSFNSVMRSKVRHEAELNQGVQAFIELGRDRNRLVHEDFGTFSLEKTSPEIYQSYRTALNFVENLPELLRA